MQTAYKHSSHNQALNFNCGSGNPESYSLAKYSGEWNQEAAKHLLNRAVFGFSKTQIQEVVSQGFDKTISSLFEDQIAPEPPVYYDFENDPNAELGETWVNMPDLDIQGLAGSRNRSIRFWTMGLMLNQEINIREKMVLFWHNHFVTESQPGRYAYKYINTIREHAIGSFKELTKAITVDPAMLRYLNGNQNTGAAPNENYARELLELFTIGKGELAGSGDYTTFTEHDVQQMARILTGWVVRAQNDMIPSDVISLFIPNRHDNESKVLSHRFDSVTINGNGDQEYIDLIDIIFQKEEVAKFICRKLYRYFVYYKIDDQVESNIIEPLAIDLIANDFVIKPILESLLSSEHFFDMAFRGTMIKNPFDFIVGMAKQFDYLFPEELNPKYKAWGLIYAAGNILGMQYFFPPNVAGWKAYYQEPVYYRYWINSVSVPIRFQLISRLIFVGIKGNGVDLDIPALDFISQIDNATDPNDLINGIAALVLPKALYDEQILSLKEVLIPGLPDFEWTTEYSAYLNDPTNEDLKQAIENKVKNLLNAMLLLPEYQLI